MQKFKLPANTKSLYLGFVTKSLTQLGSTIILNIEKLVLTTTICLLTILLTGCYAGNANNNPAANTAAANTKLASTLKALPIRTINAIYSYNDLILAGGSNYDYSSGIVYSTVNFAVWTPAVNNFPQPIQSFTSTNLEAPYTNIIAAVGLKGTISSSTDGVHWKQNKFPFECNSGSCNLFGIVHYKQKYIVVGDFGMIAASTDLVHWNKIKSPGGDQAGLKAITVNNKDQLIAVGMNGLVITSNDGEHWKKLPISTNVTLTGAALDDFGEFAAVGANSVIVSNINTPNYTYTFYEPKGRKLNDIAFHKNTFVAVGEAGTIFTSNDALNHWSNESSGINSDLYSITYSKYHNSFLAAGNGGDIAVSYDGFSWQNSENIKQITGFSINNSPGLINGESITVNLPFGTDITKLVPIFTFDGLAVTVNGNVQQSGKTLQNFTSQVKYTVHAADNTTRSYLVTVVKPYKYAYIASKVNNTVTRCAIKEPVKDSFMNFSDCEDIKSELFDGPSAVTTIGNHSVLITNYNSNKLLKCTIDLSSCALAAELPLGNYPFHYPVSINVFENRVYITAIVSDWFNSSRIVYCDLKNNEISTPCSYYDFSDERGPERFTDLTFSSSPYRTYAVYNNLNLIQECPGVLNCISNIYHYNLINVDSPWSLKLHPFGKYAYITSTNKNQVIKCDVNDAGNLVNCADSGVKGLDGPTGLTIEFPNNPGGIYAYISNTNGNTLTACYIDFPNADLVDCVNHSFIAPDNTAIASNN